MLQIIVAIVFFLPIFIESNGHWSYENIKAWSRDNHYCNGNLQSPIDLRFNISRYSRRLKQIHFQHQRSSEPLQFSNNGHTAQLNMKNHYIIKHITPDSEDYKVEQLHFHWGQLNNNITGSEHLLDGQSYPLEMHIVSYSSLFSNLKEAMTNTRALAVVGVFFELSDETNELLEPIVNASAHIRHKEVQQSVSPDFDLINLIGELNLHRYYRYDGSLTTPPCYESVIWSVVQEPVKISMNQLNAFRSLHDDRHQFMKNTYRPVQPINTRKLYRSFHAKNIADEPRDYMPIAENRGEDLSMNMKLIFLFVSYLMMRI